MTLAFYAVVYNCENTILPFIEHIKIANEYVIIDDGSTDLTYENAIEFQTDKEFKCIKKEHKGHCAAHLQDGLSIIQSDYVLRMDFDEVVPIEVQYQLLEILKEPQYDIYKLLRYNFLDGEPWPNLEQEYKPRLYKKESVFYENRIHTEAQPVEGFTVSPDDPTIFFNHYKTRKEMNDCNARYKAIVETELAAGNEKYEKLRNWYK